MSCLRLEKTTALKITRLDDGRALETEDRVIKENILIIKINGRHVVGLAYLPGMEKELVFGHLFTTGIIKSVDEVQDYSYSNSIASLRFKEGINVEDRFAGRVTGGRLVISACGSPEYFDQLRQGVGISKVLSNLRVESETIFSAVKTMNKGAATFHISGSSHAATLFTKEGDLLLLSEDVGKHNAVDKIIGAAILSGIKLEESFLLCSGRQTVDIVVKAARAGIPIFAALSAPTDSGVFAAESTNITLIGFIRGKRMNIYTHPHRILL